MRTIKFRTYDKGTGKFHFWGFVRDGFIGPPCSNGVMLRDCEQFTGLLDKNGVEIYEGDVVKFRSHPEKTRVMKVKYNSDIARFQVVDAEGWHTFQHFNSIEVIGNIHENPELLTP